MSDQTAPSKPTMTIDGKRYDGSQTGEYIYFTDKGGHSIKFKLFEGSYYFPLYELSILEQIKTFRMKPDDIILTSYPRTGTHWMFEVVSMLLNGKAETIEKWKGSHSLEFHSSEELSDLPSPRYLNAHMKLSNGPIEAREKKCKMIYNLRDPKDVAVSLYALICAGNLYEYNGQFEDYLYLFMDGKAECGGVFDHYRDAERFFDKNPDIPVHFHVYEEAHKNPVLEVQKLSDFLGLNRNNELCQAIADKCLFSQMLVDKEKYSLLFEGKNFFYRQGIVGDWKNWFTDQMLEDYYRVYEEKMAGSRFYERYARQK